MPTELSNLARAVLPLLEEFVQNNLGTDALVDTIRDRVFTDPSLAGLDRSLIEECLEELFRRRGLFQKAPEPRLLVDWGELPKIGFQNRPEFNLVCDPTWSEPEIHVVVDRQLDHDAEDPARRSQRFEAGLWSFHVPFRLTTQGIDCLPGHYLIRVEIAFRKATNQLPRFYQTSIRLNIPSTSESGERVLEIDGDGQSVVNLHGHNLSSFSKVVLKGGDQGIINLQSSGLKNDPALNEEPDSEPSASFEYQLKPNLELENRLPAVHRSGPLHRTEALSLKLASGKRIHLLAKKRVTFGRSRENDIVLRFIPRSEENDNNTRNLSRTHMVIDCCDEGVVLKDTSSKGIELNYKAINEELTLPSNEVGYSQSLELAPARLGHTPFGLDIQLFGSRQNSDDREEHLAWDEICFDLMGERPGRLWQFSASNHIDAFRLVRDNNQPDLEEYVLIYREAQLGANDCAIDIGRSTAGGDVRLFHAGRAFWLQTQPSVTIQVDQQIYQEPVIFPLQPDQTLRIVGTEILVERFEQQFDLQT